MRGQIAQQKYYSLQIVRAIAAWTILYLHFMQDYFSFQSETVIGTFVGKYGSLGVDTFFVLSGFVMYLCAGRPHQTASTFAINRIFRIVPAYWFYTLALPVFIYCFPKEFAYTDYNLTTLLGSLFFIPTENPSGIGVFPLYTLGWTLNFEMFFYAVLAICLLLRVGFETHVDRAMRRTSSMTDAA
jgi:exopolysaccharide production protein ExoZ